MKKCWLFRLDNAEKRGYNENATDSCVIESLNVWSKSCKFAIIGLQKTTAKDGNHMNIETANRLYELRKQQVLSQEELAEKLGVSRQAVSKWERSEASPDTDNLIALAKIYGLSLDELIFGEKQSEQKEEPTEEIIEEISDDTTKVKIGPTAIFVESDDGDKVKIDLSGIKITDGKHIHINCDGDDDDDDDDYDEDDVEAIEKSGGKAKFWLSLPYPIICVIAYLLFGCMDILGGFGQSWIIFVTIPLYYSLIHAIAKKRFCDFAYPVFCAFAFLYLGMYHDNWHPSWVIFITIPIYYSIAGYFDKRRKEKENKNA